MTALQKSGILDFKAVEALDSHYAMIGMATVVSGVPLFCETANEHGLSMVDIPPSTPRQLKIININDAIEKNQIQISDVIKTRKYRQQIVRITLVRQLEI
ncbi:MAG: linear amide C-N hydrolase [Clostridia bacterium]|nr:linear amide C-N hydrolase [Clostridia bacterium]